MLDIGIQELLVIMVLALLVFGPDKLPDLGRRLGRAMRAFRRASDEFRQTVETNLQIHEDILPPSAAEPASPAPVADVTTTDPVAGSAGGPEGPAEAPPGETAAESNGHAPAEPAEPFWTSRGGRLLHRGDCVWRVRVAAADRVGVKTVAEGWEQGLRPCPVCDPREAVVTS